MRIILRIIIILLQLVVGQLLGFVPAYALGVGEGRELLVIGLGYALGVWGVGMAGEWAMKRLGEGLAVRSLIGTLLGSFLGILAILLTPAFGFAQLLLPLMGALAGYYVAGVFSRAAAN
ncbi:MAG: hypothetical protein J5I90_19525 [Caldilineales bacterium]|nr:hypothetical protein [Caldilineales bacterium]